MVAIYALITMHLFALMTPGLDFAVVSQTAAKHSFKKAAMSAMGVSCAIFFWATAAVSGLSMLARVTLFHIAVSIVGATYLFWIGIQLIKSSFSKLESSDKQSPESDFFMKGFITNISNPKAIIYFGSIFSTFINVNESWCWNIFLSVIIFMESLVWFAIIAKVFSFNSVRIFYKNNTSVIEVVTGVVFLIFSAIIVYEVVF